MVTRMNSYHYLVETLLFCFARSLLDWETLLEIHNSLFL
jgi:hypothetical protein